jgi:hypothetical protein
MRKQQRTRTRRVKAPPRPTTKAPKLFGRPMRRTGDTFTLRYAGWSFLLMPIGIRRQWSYSLCTVGTPVSGMLLSENYDSAERAAAELDQLVSSLAIAVVTSNPAPKHHVQEPKPKTKSKR